MRYASTEHLGYMSSFSKLLPTLYIGSYTVQGYHKKYSL